MTLTMLLGMKGLCRSCRPLAIVTGCSSLVAFASLAYVPPRCPGLEVPSGSCSGLPPRSLLFHPGYQRLQFPSINGTGDSLSLFPYFNSSDSYILGGCPLCLEWASIGTAIAPQSSLQHILHVL